MKRIKLPFNGVAAIIVFTLIIIFIGVLSWGVTCGIVYLICKCFGWEWFTLLKATGIWLASILISGAFKSTVKVSS